mmetsp:Transcript_12040/g.18159  ORF Transcript_12040/g.18159 Transcript_12040/m.18159 type:complete len:694 (-) Transcript_12040:326-2407(-)
MSTRGTNNATTNGSHFMNNKSIRDDAIYAALSTSLTSPARDIYTRALYRLCLKFTTSEDEDEGKMEPATAFWTIFGHDTTIGNAANTNANTSSSTNASDDICRKMDDSMSGPASGILSVLPFLLPPNYGNSSSHNRNDNPALLSLTQRHAANAALSCGWHAYGDRGDAAVRCGKARILSNNNKDKKQQAKVKLLSLDAMRWELCKGASFAAGNSVFVVDDVNLDIRQVTVCCTKGPIKGKFIDIAASRCPFVFGRAHEADLCVMDRELSRRHGAIVYIPPCNAKPRGAFVLVDLESTNGSYMRLVGPYGARGIGAVSIGDEFIVGRTGFSVNRFDFGISESIGARPTMEDRTVVIQSLLQLVDINSNVSIGAKLDYTELAMTSFCGVFDGHGGDECSNYLVDALPENIIKFMLAEKDSLKKAVETSTRQANNANAAQMAEDAASEIMRRILKTAYLQTDNDFIKPRGAPQSGSTAATVVLFGRRLFAANVGDSRVVLCRNGGQCVELTSDHKPSRPDEAARVRAAGGFILHKRVMGELAITRAFGDKSFKMGIKAMLEEDGEYNDMSGGTNSHENGNGNNDSTNDGNYDGNGMHMGHNGRERDLTAPLVSAEPEIASTILSHQDEFLLLACDGLFDVFRSQDAIALARQELIAHRGEPAEVARILSDQAIRVRRSRDNVSILIVVFRPFWKEA